MKIIIRYVTLMFISIFIFLLYTGCSKPTNSRISYPNLRVLCTEDISQMDSTNAKFSIVRPFSFGGGQPWVSYPKRDGFASVIQKAKTFTDAGHKNGYTFISYISKTISGGPTPDELPLVKIYREGRWSEYADYFGPEPPKSPKDWIEKRADGSLGGYTWVSPSGVAGFHSFACANNPYFHRYMKGIVKVLIDMGIDGFYMDHTEGKGCYCEYCDHDFREYLAQGYPDNFVTWKYNLSGIDKIALPKDDKDPLWIEWRKFISKSQVKIHQLLKEEATELGDTDFIVSGNLFGAGGFGFAALNGSDIEMAGDLDVILYSEIVPSTTSREEAYLTISGHRDNTRISNSPLYKHMAAAHHEQPILVYPLYPESPNPVEKESGLFNIQRLTVAEGFANRTSMRRVEKNHSKYVIKGAKEIYTLIKAVENQMAGAKFYSNVAILTSLNQFYHGAYSYIYSASRALNDAGISHKMIVESDLNPDALRGIDVLLLPYLPLLSDVSETAINSFVKNGGTAIMIGPCGIMDQYGMKKHDPVLMNLLESDSTNIKVVKKNIGSGIIVYMPVDQQQLDQFGELLKTYNNDESEGYTISIYQHKVFGWGQYHEHLKDTWAKLPKVIKETATNGLLGVIDTPEKAELTTMLSPDGKRLFAHIVNYQVGLNGELTPLKEATVTLRIPKNKQVKAVLYSNVAAPAPQKIGYEEIENNGARFIKIKISDEEIYGIISVEL